MYVKYLPAPFANLSTDMPLIIESKTLFAPIAVTPELLIVMSPLTATAAAWLEPLPNQIFAEVRDWPGTEVIPVSVSVSVPHSQRSFVLFHLRTPPFAHSALFGM